MTGPKPSGPTHPTPTGPPKTQHVRIPAFPSGSDRAGALTPRPGAVPGLSDPPDPKPIPNPHPHPPPHAS